ncbi:hypothetical protein MHBO_001934 [Bonamia ostreae]|uniref:Nop domain-containing protein n=1 Tax=Bonamia ostreae TaxID=126728 RepID=A0ABV2ALG9_9EUKA
MTTIADAFLDDFEEEELQKTMLEPEIEVKVETINMDESEDEIQNEKITELLENKNLAILLEKTDSLLYKNPSSSFNSINEDDEEYQIILESNRMIRKIEEEILVTHRYTCNIYSSRFQELEQTVLHPVQYAKVVLSIKNDLESVNTALDGILTEHQMLSTSISASATSGKPLPESDLKKALESCKITIKLDEARNKLLDYIKSRMLHLSPNLCALVGTEIAAELMTIAGGLNALSKIPSCNLQTLGSVKKEKNRSFELFYKSPHLGLLMKTNIILECPEEFQTKALRLLSAKVSLAVRLDCHQTDRSNEKGHKYKEEIQNRVEKWQEPPEIQPVKPLPLPAERRKSKRAGKRYRKMREKYKVTELQRMKNRVGFNIGEDNDDVEGESFGMIGKSGTGGLMKIVGNKTSKVRKLDRMNKLMIDRERKKRQRKLKKGEASGLATSVVMTEVQGMSFVNPEVVLKESGNNGSGTSTYFGTKSFNKIKI